MCMGLRRTVWTVETLTMFLSVDHTAVHSKPSVLTKRYGLTHVLVTMSSYKKLSTYTVDGKPT